MRTKTVGLSGVGEQQYHFGGERRTCVPAQIRFPGTRRRRLNRLKVALQ